MKKTGWMVLLLVPVLSFSQSLCPCSFKGFISGGMTVGDREIKPLFQASGGILYSDQRFYTGIGAGIDLYRFSSVPVFADMRMYFGQKKEGFIYGNIGFNIAATDKDMDNGVVMIKLKDKLNGGVYSDTGWGYRLALKGHNSLSVRPGFSHKRIKNQTQYRSAGCASCDDEKYTYQYDLQRAVIKLSWELGK